MMTQKEFLDMNLFAYGLMGLIVVAPIAYMLISMVIGLLSDLFKFICKKVSS